MNIFCGHWGLVLLMVINCTEGIAAEKNSGIIETQPSSQCTLSVSNQTVDYGVQSRWQMQDINGRNVTPGIRVLTVNVICPYKRKIILNVQGKSGKNGELRYGQNGQTLFQLVDAQLDGYVVEMRPLTSSGTPTDVASEKRQLAIGQRLAPVVKGQLAEGKSLTARLEIQPVMPEGDARVNSLQRNESLLTLTLGD